MDKLTPCAECGMPCEPGEYHPFAACLLFKQTHDSESVRANLKAIAEHAVAALASDAAGAPVGYVNIRALTQLADGCWAIINPRSEGDATHALYAAPVAPAAAAPISLWQTGVPPVKDGKSKEFILAVRRGKAEKVFVFAAAYANNYTNDGSLEDRDGKDSVANGWFLNGLDMSGEFNEVFEPISMNEAEGDAIVGWQELPKWDDPPPTVAADAAAPSVAENREGDEHSRVLSDLSAGEFKPAFPELQAAPAYSAPFTTDVPQCCGDPVTCNDPCQAQPDERTAFIKAVQSLAFLCRTEPKRLDNETLAALDNVENHLVAMGASVRDDEGELTATRAASQGAKP